MPATPSRTARPATAGWVGWMLPSVGDLLFVILLISMCSGVWIPRLLGDAGIGWHIRNGDLMLNTHAVTRVDPFSSTMSGQRWYAWEWLYDLLIAAIHRAAGLNGVVFFTALVIAVTFVLTFRGALARGANLPVSVAMLALSMGASAIHLFARPHVLSWLMVVIWFRLLDSWEAGRLPSKDRALLWLPPLMALWVNLHGGFLTGFMLLALYLASGFLRWAASQELARRLVAKRKLKNLAKATGLCALATLVNPYGYRLYSHLFEYLSSRFLMNHIEEFLSPNFHGVGEQCFAGLLVITLIALAVERERPRLSELLLILFAAGSGLYAARNLPVSSLLLTMVVAPILSRAVAGARGSVKVAAWLRGWLYRWDSFSSRVTKTERTLGRHLWPALAVMAGIWICLHGGRLGSRQLLDAQFPAKRFPVQAVAQIERLDIREPIFCLDYWGGYLIYELYPRNRVVVDDRHDLYGEQFFKNYLKVVRVEPGWDAVLANTGAKWVLLPVDSTLANVLKLQPQWTVQYEDNTAVLFTRQAHAETAAAAVPMWI